MQGITIGIDNRDGMYFAARIDRHTGRPEVKALLRFDAEHFTGHHLLEGGELVVSLPDDLVLLKKIVLKDREYLDEKLQFEMSQAILDDPSDFLFDSIETEIDDYYLGLMIRRTIVESLTEPFTRQNGGQPVSVKAMTRSQALANGFLTFCRNNSGELGGIIDFTKNAVSIAFFYKNKIIDLAGSKLNGFDLRNEEYLNKISVEIKTLLNFKTASFFERGISLPVSTLFMMGETVDENSMSQLSDRLKINITRPEINTGFLSNRQDSSDIPLDKYLVALGLTVD